MMSSNSSMCVIGDPIEHTLSPVIQNAMLKKMALPEQYEAVRVSSGILKGWVSEARSGYAGFNVTMPHKSAILPLMDVLSQDAKLNGAVNTVAVRDGLLHGFNTDGQGFILALSDCGIDVHGIDAVLLGSGGAARAVAVKLALCGAKRVTICCRNLQKAQNFLLKTLSIDVLPWSDIAHRVSACDLLVNCTPLGMEGIGSQFSNLDFLNSLQKKAFVCDVIYRPSETLFLHTARECGHDGMNGLPMLINQAVLSLELFLGHSLPIKCLQKVAKNALVSNNALPVKTFAES